MGGSFYYKDLFGAVVLRPMRIIEGKHSLEPLLRQLLDSELFHEGPYFFACILHFRRVTPPWLDPRQPAVAGVPVQGHVHATAHVLLALSRPLRLIGESCWEDEVHQLLECEWDLLCEFH